MSSQQYIHKLSGHSEGVYCLAVWRNYLWSGSYDKTIKQWSASGHCLNTLHGHTGVLRCLCVWRDFLCSGSNDKTIQVWNLNGECINQWKTESFPYSLTVWKNFLCTGHYDGSIKLWNDYDVECTLTLNGHTGSVWCLVVDGDSLFSGSSDKTIRKWNIEGKCV